jgi:hypothetical protein
MGTIVFFDKGKEELFTGGMNLSATYRCALLSSGWTPDIDISSYANSISSFAHTDLSGTVAAIRNCPGPGQVVGDVTQSGALIFNFNLSDIIFTASAALDLCAQYAVLIQSGVDTPLAYMELSSAEVVAHEVEIIWP